MAGTKIVDLPALGRNLASTDLFELSLAGGTGSRKITGQEIINATGITIGTTAITSGTVGRVLFEGTGNVVQESASLFWDNTNGRLGIGLNNPQGATHIAVATGTPALILSDVGSPNTLPTLQFRRGPLSAYSLQIDFPSNNKARLQIGDAVTGYELTGGNVALTGGRSIEFGGVTGQIATGIIGSVQTDNNNGQLTFSTRGSGTTAERMRIFNTGNIGINTTTDAGYKFDVNGTARVQGDLTVTGTRVSISNAAMSIDANVGTGYYNIRNNSGSAGTTAITLGGNTYLNIYQPISASSGITSGTINTITTPITYAWASGTASPNLFQLNPNYNFTGTYTGTARGFYYNPTLTSIVGLTHFAFHSTSGRIRFENLPTSPAGLSAGDVWNNLGILTIV